MSDLSMAEAWRKLAVALDDRATEADRPDAEDPASEEEVSTGRGAAAGVIGPRPDAADLLSEGPDDATQGESSEIERSDDPEESGDSAGGRLPRPRFLLRTRRRKLVAGAVVAAVVAGSAVAVTDPFAAGSLPAGTALEVGGHSITVSDFNSQVAILNSLYGVQAPASSNRSAYSGFIRTTAKALAVQMILGDVAARKGVVVSQKTARDTLDTVVSKYYAGNQTKFAAALSSAGLTENQVLQQVTNQLIEDQLFSKVVGHPSVTAAQVTETFSAQKAALATPEMRAVSHIVVSSQSQARSILTQLGSGVSFATLAARYSLDKATSGSGGALGSVSESQLVPAFGKAAFAATVGQPFGPVQEQGGTWDVGLVTAVSPPKAATDSGTVQTAIRNWLADKAELATWDAWLGKQITSAHVRYAATYRPAHPDSPPAVSLPSLATFVADSQAGTATPAPSTAP